MTLIRQHKPMVVKRPHFWVPTPKEYSNIKPYLQFRDEVGRCHCIYCGLSTADIGLNDDYPKKCMQPAIESPQIKRLRGF